VDEVWATKSEDIG